MAGDSQLRHAPGLVGVIPVDPDIDGTAVHEGGGLGKNLGKTQALLVTDKLWRRHVLLMEKHRQGQDKAGKRQASADFFHRCFHGFSGVGFMGVAECGSRRAFRAFC